jgi:hypothetical protein
LCVAVAAVSVVLAVLISGLYANATVWAGAVGSRADCGTVWEPNAVTSGCATALKERAWAAATLLGIALFGALGAVVVAARSPRGVGRQVAALAAIVGAGVIIAGPIWGGVIDRTVGA